MGALGVALGLGFKDCQGRNCGNSFKPVLNTTSRSLREASQTFKTLRRTMKQCVKLSGITIICMTLIQCPFHPRVTAVACKDPSHSATSTGGRLRINTQTTPLDQRSRSGMTMALSMLPHWRVKDPGHSAKSAGGRLHLNMLTPLTQRCRSGLTMPLSRHSVGTYQERAHTQLVREHSDTVVSGRRATVD